MILRFTKMHGLGNDFMVIDGISQSVDLSSDTIHQLADRHRGIGFDQLLLVEAAPDASFDFTYRIFNADGSEVGQCGNGARCFARFVTDKGLINKKNIRVMTQSGALELELQDDELVRVNMGVPKFEPENIPLEAKSRSSSYNLVIDGKAVEFCAVSMGNPHAVLVVDNCDQAPVTQLGAQIECHPFFPQRVNVGFMQIVDRTEVILRVLERGAGETQACGSGACAAMVCGRLLDKLDASVLVHLRGGDLQIEWEKESAPVFMTGSATSVYEGQISL